MALRSTSSFLLLSIGAIVLAAVLLLSTGQDRVQLLNVSYDPTRELYGEINPLFERAWQEEHNEALVVRQSHGGSGKQARSVIDGLQADVVTLALAYDIDIIAEKTKRLPDDWQTAFPHNSSPFTSTIVFLVRKGNPKSIRDWNDLVKGGVSVVTPNPKTSGGARWNYLAAWAYAEKQAGGDEEQVMGFMRQLFRNVPVLDTGARGSTNSFVQRNIGDVLLAWENEAMLSQREFPDAGLEIVYPSLSVLAEPPVAVVTGNAERKGTAKAAAAYLEFLYTPESQRIGAKHYYRPADASIAAEFTEEFPAVEMVSVDDAFGGWKQAQKKHFSDGGLFDRIYQEK